MYVRSYDADRTDSAYGCHTEVPTFLAMSREPDLFQFLSDVRHQRPMLLVPIAEDDATAAGSPEVVIPACPTSE